MGITGNKKRVVDDGTEKAASLQCEVGLGLRTQRTESFPTKSMMVMPHRLPPPPPPPYLHPCSETTSMSFGGGDGVGGGRTSFCSLSNQVGRLSKIYDVVGGGSVSTGSVAVPRSTGFLPFPSDSSLKSSGDGGMQVGASARGAAFTASQWQELERQTLIYKYMMSAMPVPPELLVPISKSPSPSPSSQSNMSGVVDLRFSRNSDPEPWRCKRTDGKKWRCSRDVAPHQKYCERHAHKSRSRSRKHVESSQHHPTATAAAAASSKIVSTNLTTHPLRLPANSAAQAFQNPAFHLPTMASGATCGQSRCSEWVIKGDPIPGSILDQQWQQLMLSSSRLKMYNNDQSKDVFVFQPQYEEQEPLSTNSYINDMVDSQGFNNQQANDQFCPLIGPEMLQGATNGDESQRTRRFIDAWSLGERSGEEMDEIGNKCSVSSGRKLPLSSLSLSMSGAIGMDEETTNALPLMGPEREDGSSFRSQWPNPVSWMSSPPGGPLGEALCLGIVSNAKASSDAPSPHGCSNNSTTTSNCSKSSCEDSSQQGLHFH
ncbi:growth-regulating factor 8-like [Diospyros lotus]|uniref:growth-regulating factor 8-like n=1 Tax=Diospyros lotus TaxID=55363 RepID=UPI00225AC93B|nr:growth-regulating factor 8-like [Diospyros lotus]